MPSGETVTQEAERIVGGDRRKDYGDVRESFERVAEVWSAILGSKISAAQVCQCMVGLKLIRQANKHKHDNLVDICGYVLLEQMLKDATEEAERVRSGHAKESSNAAGV